MVCIFLTPFFTAVYIVEWLVLQTIYVLNKEILQFLALKSAVWNQERVIIARVRYMYLVLLIQMFQSRKIRSLPWGLPPRPLLWVQFCQHESGMGKSSDRSNYEWISPEKKSKNHIKYVKLWEIMWKYVKLHVWNYERRNTNLL